MLGIGERVARERSAVGAHRASLRGASLPPPREAPKGTFAHGFFLPFSLIVATLRDRELRGPYLKVTAWRLFAVSAFAALACATGSPEREKKTQGHGPVVVLDRAEAAEGAPAASGLHVDVPGVHIDIDARRGAKSEVRMLGQDIPVIEDERPRAERAAEDASRRETAWLASGWAWLLALVALLSGVSKVVSALSRRYDDWLGFGISALAFVRPEDDERKTPKVFIDRKWIVKKT